MKMVLPLTVLMICCAGHSLGQQTSPTSENPATASPAGSEPSVYNVGGAVTPPAVLKKVGPTWPKNARKRRIEGRCLIALVVDAEGNPQDIHVLRSIGENLTGKDKAAAAELDRAALQAVAEYRFVPAQKDGKPVPVRVNVEVNFKLMN